MLIPVGRDADILLSNAPDWAHDWVVVFVVIDAYTSPSVLLI